MTAFGIYVHWPFCLIKCPYCDFNSHVRNCIDQKRWRSAFLSEISYAANETPGRKVSSIFFGGGTPSLMPPDTAAAVIDKIGDTWGLIEGAEITLEANPTSVEAENFTRLAEAGINRLSLGVQSFDETALKFLGRRHSVQEALNAIELAATHFEHFSFDLIYALPGQSRNKWQFELSTALSLAGSHLSLYQLTIEPGTPFYGLWRQNRLSKLGDDVATSMYIETRDRLATEGLPGYEISNHAIPGSECQHNLLYWRYEDYVGIGPGAHGRVTENNTKFAIERRRLPERWLAAVEQRGHGTRHRVALDQKERLTELIIMGLRTTAGISEAQFQRELGVSYANLIDEITLTNMRAAGLIDTTAGSLRATEKGQLKLDGVIEHLINSSPIYQTMGKL